MYPNHCFLWWFCIEPDRYMRINFALILWRRMIEFPPALLALPKHQSMTICSPCSSTPPSSLDLPTTVRPNTLWTKILNESKKKFIIEFIWWFHEFYVLQRIYEFFEKLSLFIYLYVICNANVNNKIYFHGKNSLHKTKKIQSLVCFGTKAG